MDYFDLKEHQNKKVAALSGGCKRKLSLILAIIGCPEVMLLDEPTESLDPQGRERFWKLFNSNFKNKKMVLCTHRLEEADKICSKIALINKGLVVAEEDLKQLKSRLSNTLILRVSGCANKENILGKLKKYNIKEIYEGAYSLELNQSKISDVLSDLRSVRKDTKLTLASESLENVYIRMINKEDS